MGDDGCVVRLRGLPWSATGEEVVKFFGSKVDIVDGAEGVHFTYTREGRPTGEAFVQLSSEEDVDIAVLKHNEHMGNRYIEVFRSKAGEMDWVVKRAGRNQPQGSTEAVVRLRGLPFGCSKEEVAQFFTGLEIVPNGIMLPEDMQGRHTGEAYVQFSNQDIAERALLKHKERIGHRYIEIFKSSLNEASSAMDLGTFSKPRPLMGGGGGGGGMGRPGPYDRSDRFGMMGGAGGGMGNMGGGGYGRGRGGRNVKGFYDDDYEDMSGMGMGGGMGGGGMGGGMGGMGMNRRAGNMRPQQRMGGGGGGGNNNNNSSRFPGIAGYGDTGRDPRSQPGSHYISQTGHSVHMRGLPFQALETDISDFFSPLNPVKIEFEFSNVDGRPTGEANVDFESHQEAVNAMKKHKQNMQHRYIELFLNSTPQGSRNQGMGMDGEGFDGGNTSSGGGYGGTMGGGMNTMGGGGSGSMGNMGGAMGGNMAGGMGGNMAGGMGGNMGGAGMGMNRNPNYTAF